VRRLRRTLILQVDEHSQHLARITADIRVGDVNEANHTSGIDDKGGTLGGSFALVEDAKLATQFATKVGERR